jgi:hypothetical protein
MSVQEMLQEARSLSTEERKELMKGLVDLLTEAPQTKVKRRISEFRGLGAHLYDGTDAQEHVSQMREEWDKNP